MADNQNQKTEEKKEEKPKQPAALESILNETSQVGKGLVNSAIGLSALGFATKYFGLDGLVTALSFPVGGMIEKRLLAKKEDESEGQYQLRKQFKSKHFRDEAIAGAAFTVPLWYGVNYLRGLPTAFGLEGIASTLAVGGLTFASIPLFNLFYYPITYLAHNKTFKGLAADFKKEYWKGTKKALYLGGLWVLPVMASVANPALYPFLFPILAGFEVAYRVILSREKLDYKKLLNPFTYIPKFTNPLYVISGGASALGRGLGNAYRGITSAASDLGSAVRDLFRKPASKPA